MSTLPTGFRLFLITEPHDGQCSLQEEESLRLLSHLTSNPASCQVAVECEENRAQTRSLL